MKILVIGRSGQVARALAREGALRGLDIEALGRPEIDLSQPRTIAASIAARKPAVIINAAAYTAVDKAEDEPERAFALNAHGAEAAARGAADAGATFIQVSTDYVFSGEKAAPYLETDACAPTGVYGVSKVDGERRVLAAHPGAIVVRTAWVFDAAGANFVRTMLRLAKTRSQISVVADQVGCPTFARDFAGALLSIAATRGASAGIYHCAGGGETNWAAFATEIFALSRERGGPSAEVTPIPASAYPTRAQRPANSRLDCAKLKRDYGVAMRPWREALVACMDEVAAGGWRVE